MAQWKRAARLGAILATTVLMGVTLLWATTLLPAAPIRSNVATGARVLTAEGSHPGRFFPFNTYVGDNFTDALMLNISYPDPGATFSDTLVARYYGGVLDNPVGSLQARVDGGLGGEVAPDAVYERYWHGYLAFTRPALTVLSYPQMRLLNAVLLSVVLSAAVAITRRRIGLGAAGSLLAALAVVGAPVIVYNLQFVGVFYIALGGVIAALSNWRRRVDRFDLELFLVLGMLTSFIDFLTVPVLTLGLPLLALMASEVSTGARAHSSRYPRLCCVGNGLRALLGVEMGDC